MILLGLITGLGTILLAGFGVTLLLLRNTPRLNAAECLSLAWLFGCGAVSMLLFLGGIVMTGLPLQLLVMLGCVMLAFCGWKTKAGARWVVPKPANKFEWFVSALIAFGVLAMFFASAQHTLGWDGLLNWEIKARYAFLNSGVLPSAYYVDAARVFSHPEYPLLIPMTETWLYLWMGEANQFWVKIIFPLFYAAGAVVLALVGSRVAGRRWPGLVVAALLVLVPFLANGTGGVVVGYADFPLSVIYLAVIGYLLTSLKQDDAQSFRVYAAAMAILPWMKREGIVLWLVAVFCGAIVLWKRRGKPGAWLSLLGGVAVLIGWRVYLHAVHAVGSHDFQTADWTMLEANVYRVGPVFREVFMEMGQASDWSFFWWIAAIAIGTLTFRARQVGTVLLSLGVFAPIVLFGCSYVFSAWPDYLAHMSTSFPRLLLQVMPVGWLAVAAAAGTEKEDREGVD